MNSISGSMPLGVHRGTPQPQSQPTNWTGVTPGGRNVQMQSLSTSTSPMLGAARQAAQRPVQNFQAAARPSGPAREAQLGQHRAFHNLGDAKVGVRTNADGSIVFSRTPPPINEITFSGGGGKGAALPGALKALENAGILKQDLKLHGASVGSITAACMAAGMTADRFTDISKTVNMKDVVLDGKDMVRTGISGAASVVGNKLTGGLFKAGLSGARLEEMVRTEMRQSVCERIADLQGRMHAREVTVDPQAAKQMDTIYARLRQGGAVTFGDLRILSKIIPEIKETVISGTYFADNANGKMQETKPQVTIFSADTQPDMDVALAVHASAALPPVFKPVDITLSNGITARFMDGGVLNNAPKSDLIDADRSVDRIASGSKVIFAFEEDALDDALAGKPKPQRDAAGDFFTKGLVSHSDYARYRGLADNPDEVVKVPLKFGKEDYSDFKKGTVNFNIKPEHRDKLQSMTHDATVAHLEKMKLPREHSFSTPAAMLNSIPRQDLAELAKAGYPGATDALNFRDDAVLALGDISRLARDAKPEDLAKGGALHTALHRLDQSAKGDPERLAFLGREIARGSDNGLTRLIDLAKAYPDHGFASIGQGLAVEDGQRSKTLAFRVLREELYPKMVKVKPNGIDGAVLRAVDNMLREAGSRKEVLTALDVAIRHFDKESYIRSEHRDPVFANTLSKFRAIVAG